MAKDKKKSKDKNVSKKAAKPSVKPSKIPAKKDKPAGKSKPVVKPKPSSKSTAPAAKKVTVPDKKTKSVKPVKAEKVLKKVKKEKKLKKLKKEKVARIGKAIIRKSTTPPVHIPRPAPIKLNREMQEIRSRLQKMLAEMRRDIDKEVRGASDRDLAHINDTSDMASDSAEGDLALRIAESETVEAAEIERALDKIEAGTYGTCETCSQPIAPGRLEYLPYVTLCIKCQELSEIRRRESGEELDDLAEGADVDAENN